MELLIQPGHDSKSALRDRVVCDERITLTKQMFDHIPEVWPSIVDTLKGEFIEVTQFYRCNTMLW